MRVWPARRCALKGQMTGMAKTATAAEMFDEFDVDGSGDIDLVSCACACMCVCLCVLRA